MSTQLNNARNKIWACMFYLGSKNLWQLVNVYLGITVQFVDVPSPQTVKENFHCFHKSTEAYVGHGDFLTSINLLGQNNNLHRKINIHLLICKKWNEVKLRSVRISLKIIHLASRKSYQIIICPNSYVGQKRKLVGVSSNISQNESHLVIILPNSYEKLTKSEIRSNWNCSKSLISPLESNIWLLFAPIHTHKVGVSGASKMITNRFMPNLTMLMYIKRRQASTDSVIAWRHPLSFIIRAKIGLRLH